MYTDTLLKAMDKKALAFFLKLTTLASDLLVPYNYGQISLKLDVPYRRVSKYMKQLKDLELIKLTRIGYKIDSDCFKPTEMIKLSEANQKKLTDAKNGLYGDSSKALAD